METPESQTENRMEGIRQTVMVGEAEINAHFAGNVLRFDGQVVINRTTLNLQEALIASIDVISFGIREKKVQESIFLLLLVQTISELSQDGETLRQTPFGRMEPGLLHRTKQAMTEARQCLEQANVILGEMVQYDVVHAA